MDKLSTKSDSYVRSILEYVLETEIDSFLAEPSDDHVYYHAFYVMFGEKAAEKELKSAVEAL